MVADYEAEIAARRAVVIEAAGKVSGYMVAWPEADAYFIENIGVDPECQGNGSRPAPDRTCGIRAEGLGCRRCGSIPMQDERKPVDVRTYRVCRNAPRVREGFPSGLYASRSSQAERGAPCGAISGKLRMRPN